MPAPQPKPQASPKTRTATSSEKTHRRLRVVRHGSDLYSLYEDTYSCDDLTPQMDYLSTRTLRERTTQADAIYRARLWHVDFTGPNRTGDSGLWEYAGKPKKVS